MLAQRQGLQHHQFFVLWLVRIFQIPALPASAGWRAERCSARPNRHHGQHRRKRVACRNLRHRHGHCDRCNDWDGYRDDARDLSRRWLRLAAFLRLRNQYRHGPGLRRCGRHSDRFGLQCEGAAVIIVDLQHLDHTARCAQPEPTCPHTSPADPAGRSSSSTVPKRTRSDKRR